MEVFAFIVAVFCDFAVIAFGSRLIAYILAGDDDEDCCYRWLTVCLLFAIYIAWNTVAKNG